MAEGGYATEVVRSYIDRDDAYDHRKELFWDGPGVGGREGVQRDNEQRVLVASRKRRVHRGFHPSVVVGGFSGGEEEDEDGERDEEGGRVYSSWWTSTAGKGVSRRQKGSMGRDHQGRRSSI
ncbi:hypothetical protein NL676_024853 [Syzygium grande]|nr:hypothetical protein NL676_024853 [Syzygium grande]